MAAKKKTKSNAKAKRSAPKPKAKPLSAAKRAKKTDGAARPLAKIEAPILAPPPGLTIVRPGLQKRADIDPIGVVSVMDGDREIEQSTFYSAAGRDEYVQRWQARGYTCRFIPRNGG